MEIGTWIKQVTEIGQSTNAGFTVISLIASIACWLLYRGTRAQFTTLQEELAACNRKHALADKDSAEMRRRVENLSISAAALWTIINMSGDRRGYQLPPLNEVLEGRMVIQVRAGQPDEKGRRDAAPPLVMFEDQPGSG